ncbi:MAG: 4-hydroxy-tetrahydrodipicolinate synthase [Gammaproteobacteria bacterium]
MFHGSMVALVTPMHADESLDSEGLERLIEFHVAEGSDAIVVVGTTGESPTLDEKEHCTVIRQAVEFTKRRVPVIAGTGSNSTHEAIALTRCAMEGGADACLLVTPYSPIPQILYNVPGRTACDMLPETVARLSTIPNIVGIKEATGNLGRGREILERCDDRIDLYSGDDATAMELMLLGAKGVISVTANVAPRVMHEMCEAATAGDRARATTLNERLAGLHETLFVEANPIPVKWALYEMGLIPAGIRLPLTPLSERYHDTLRQAMTQAGING